MKNRKCMYDTLGRPCRADSGCKYAKCEYLKGFSDAMCRCSHSMIDLASDMFLKEPSPFVSGYLQALSDLSDELLKEENK